MIFQNGLKYVEIRKKVFFTVDNVSIVKKGRKKRLALWKCTCTCHANHHQFFNEFEASPDDASEMVKDSTYLEGCPPESNSFLATACTIDMIIIGIEFSKDAQASEVPHVLTYTLHHLFQL